MTLGSLFDGSGTCPLAAAMCGITPVWASEIEPYPIRVTQKNFPRMKHLGDITQINGAEIEPVELVTDARKEEFIRSQQHKLAKKGRTRRPTTESRK